LVLQTFEFTHNAKEYKNFCEEIQVEVVSGKQ